MKTKGLFAGMFVALLLAVGSQEVYACSCIIPEVPRAYDAAHAVFVGRVSDIIAPSSNDPKAPLAERLYKIKFKVEKSWKGVSSEEAVILSDQGRAGCFSWGPFLAGERYVVYAERRTPSGARIKLLAVLFKCNRTTPESNAAEDVAGLDSISARRHIKHSPSYLKKSRR